MGSSSPQAAHSAGKEELLQKVTIVKFPPKTISIRGQRTGFVFHSTTSMPIVDSPEEPEDKLPPGYWLIIQKDGSDGDAYVQQVDPGSGRLGALWNFNSYFWPQKLKVVGRVPHGEMEDIYKAGAPYYEGMYRGNLKAYETGGTSKSGKGNGKSNGNGGSGGGGRLIAWF